METTATTRLRVPNQKPRDRQTRGYSVRVKMLTVGRSTRDLYVRLSSRQEKQVQRGAVNRHNNHTRHLVLPFIYTVCGPRSSLPLLLITFSRAPPDAGPCRRLSAGATGAAAAAVAPDVGALLPGEVPLDGGTH
ncbi:hypothetical protein F2P81_007412 [Scophthalmus maximus]|uniref:Uncharacterized protein n=1 Tax=Scophthalmus maximus TaxID=52904 RepID=A0A6A4TE77_SCOMX|nr:hypothetical protein F2P81_007412 [Scophthalmus maximus]